MRIWYLLKSHSILHLVGSIAYALSQWLVLTLLIRLDSLDSAGQYVYFLAIFTPVSILLNFGLRNGIASDVGGQFEIAQYIKAKFIGMAIFAILGAAFLLHSEKDIGLGLLVLCIKLVDGFADLRYGYWILQKSAGRYGVSQLLRLAVFVVLLSAGYFLGFRGTTLLYSFPLAMLAVFVLYDLKGAEYKVSGVVSINAMALLKTYWPLAASAFLVAAQSSLPRLAIDHFLSSEAVAMYAVLIYFVTVALLPATSLTQVALPRIAMIAPGHLFVSKIFKQYICLSVLYGLAFVLGVIFAGDWFVTNVYGVEASYSLLIYLLVGLVGFSQVMKVSLSSLCVGKRLFNSMFTINLLGLGVVALASLIFIRWFGLAGGFLASLGASMITVALYGVMLARFEYKTCPGRD
ncbi:hypothetical protein BN1049_02689 [Pseudomonas saudimassiliensis]|uniref:Polysaccharide biosynthesis protein n=1 Tax=Pseudomonas saudimassiliensis TaxID=1461581 RepID=A0A078MJ57_9PSED|nr:hypothetical protein [Pseudomonas saudimassiliensis]CEA06305.1 hypothetical protein BN1049_02689 [Pseudomonas saudimassiliensis]CEF27730.1 hypothetical protein BN1049_02689 [Pseudomonas saudimassiliensis]